MCVCVCVCMCVCVCIYIYSAILFNVSNKIIYFMICNSAIYLYF